MPFEYALEGLAKRWSIPPWWLTAPLPEIVDDERALWIERGLEYQRLEASVKVGHGRN